MYFFFLNFPLDIYEYSLIAYVYNLNTIADKLEINFKNPKETPNYLITQLFFQQNKHFSMEIFLSHQTGNVNLLKT